MPVLMVFLPVTMIRAKVLIGNILPVSYTHLDVYKRQNVDRLAAEFADELDSLGVRVAALEKKSDNVKITGEARFRYADHDGSCLLYTSRCV